jgi:ethanolamine utilization protein EutA
MQALEIDWTLLLAKAPSRRALYRMHEEYDSSYLSLDGLKEEEHPMWGTERIELKSVGIDIGSSTSHLMFSRLVLRRLGSRLSSKFVVVNREIIWKSDILLTPYIDRYQIDLRGLSGFLDQSYQSAGIDPEQVDTGAVIITGEASRKENAEAITSLFSKQTGKFVCATAGPNLEAVIAAHGCGAVKKTIEDTDSHTVMVVDVGGGTSKIAIVKGGVILETAATNVGARLVAMDESGKIVRIEEAGEWVAKDLGIRLRLGMYLEPQEKEALAGRLADILLGTIDRRPLSPLAERLMVTPRLSCREKINTIVFSGGVAEYIYGIETKEYGDLGSLLGKKIMEGTRRFEFGISVEMPEERIRATVIGASQYTIQVSGSTIFISNEKLLPIRNLKVVFPRVGEITKGITSLQVEAAIRHAFTYCDLIEGEESVALAFHGLVEPRYELLRGLAEGIVSALRRTIQKGMPIVLVFNSDVGSVVGNLLSDEFKIKSGIISVDQVHLHEFDYIDVGQVVERAEAVPIVVKSLVFGKHAEESHKDRERRRHHLQ